MPRIISDDVTFVTTNVFDFRKLYAREPLHVGLVVRGSQLESAAKIQAHVIARILLAAR